MVPDQAGVVRAIDSGQAEIGIVIPVDFAAKVAQKDATVLMLVDGSNSFVTQSAFSSAQAISQQYAISLTHLQLSGLNPHMQILYNPDLKDVWFLIPGMCAFLLFGIALKLTAFSIVREREAGTIEALLVTPIRPIELMIAKMIPNLGLAFFDLAFTFFMGIRDVWSSFPWQPVVIFSLSPAIRDRQPGTGTGNLIGFSNAGAGEPTGIPNEHCGDVCERIPISGLLTTIGAAIARIRHADDVLHDDHERHHDQGRGIERSLGPVLVADWS